MASEEGCPEASRFSDLIDLLGFFAVRGKYGVLDRIGYAQSPEPIVTAVYEALRTVNAMAAKPRRVRGRVAKREGEGEAVELACIDYDVFDSKEDLLDSCNGRPLVVGQEEARKFDGKNFVCCYTKPRIPDSKNLEEFFRCLKRPEGVSLAKQVAALAFAYPSRVRG